MADIFMGAGGVGMNQDSDSSRQAIWNGHLYRTDERNVAQTHCASGCRRKITGEVRSTSKEDGDEILGD